MRLFLAPFTGNLDLLLTCHIIGIPHPPASPIVRIDILQSHHNTPSGHSGITKTFELISKNFWWKTLRGDARRFVNSCDICQRNKNNNHKPYGLLQPLAIPEKQWSSILLNFITDLPNSNNYTIILTVVDRLSKMGYFIPLKNLPSAEETSKMILDNIFKLHGIPKEIISDHGKQFDSKFFKQFCKLLHCESSPIVFKLVTQFVYLKTIFNPLLLPSPLLSLRILQSLHFRMSLTSIILLTNL